MKACSRCKVRKPLAEFHKRARSKDGHRSECKACVRKARRSTPARGASPDRPSLSLVKNDDPPRTTEQPEAPAAAPMTILQAAEADDRMAELVAMRRRLAKALDSEACPPRDMASLSRRQLEIGREIEALKAAAAKEGDDDHRATEAEAWDEAAI